MITRRSAIASSIGILAAAAATGPVRGASVSSTTTLRVAATLSESSSNLFYAAERGFFKEQGLDVQIQLLASGGAFASAILSGTFDIGGLGSGTVITAHLRGAPFVVVANGGVFDASSPQAILCTAKDSSIRSARELENKTVAVTTLNDIQQVGFYAWMDKNDANFRTTKLVEVPTSLMGQALMQGRVEAAFIGEPNATESADQIRVLASPFSAIANHFSVVCWTASKPWVEANASTAKRFTTAIDNASTWASRNKQSADDIFSKYSKLPVPISRSMRHVGWSTASPAELLQPVIDAAAKYSMISKAFPAAELLPA